MHDRAELVDAKMREDTTYAPYCMRCPRAVRMQRVSATRAECWCGAVHQIPDPKTGDRTFHWIDNSDESEQR